MTERTVTATLRLKIGDFVGGIGTSTRAVRQFRGELDQVARTSPRSLNQVALAAGGVGVALLGATGYLIKLGTEFDKQMSEVNAVSNATRGELNALRHTALQAGRDTQFTAMQAAQAEAELAKAGIGTADILGGALRGSLALAAAGQMDLADAATVAAQTMNIFQLRGRDVAHIADVLASASNTSAADMHGLGIGLQQVGLVAHQAGLSLEETVGLMAAMADRGLQGSDGATSLKTALQHLTAPTDQARTLMQQLNIQMYDAQGHMVNAAGVAGQLQHALGNLSEEQRNQALNTLFGSDAIRAATVLYQLGSTGVDRYTDAVNKTGAAQDTARKKTDNLAGDLERLRGSVETLAITSESGANGGLRDLVQWTDAAVHAFGDLPGPVQTSAVVLAGVAGASLLTSAALLKVKQTADGVMTALSEMGPRGERAAVGLGKIGSAAAKVTVVGAVVFGVYEGLSALMDATSRGSRIVTHDLDQLSQSLLRFAESGRTSGDAARLLGRSFNDFVANYSRAVTAVNPSGSTKAAGQAVQNVKDLDASFAKLVEGGYVTQAGQLAGQFTAAMLAQGDTLDHINRVYLPQYNTAAADAAVANTGLAKGFGDAAGNARTLSGTLDLAMRSGQKLTDVLQQLSGGLASFLSADIAARNAVAGLKAALEANGHTLDLNTAKGRANEQQILDLREAAVRAAQAKFEETSSVGAASEVWDRYVGQLRLTLRAAGFTDAQVNQLVRDLFTLPPSITTKVITPGLATAISGAQSLDQLLRSLNGRVSKAQVVTTYYANQSGYRPAASYGSSVPQRWGGALEHAQAGLLREAQVYPAGSGPLYAFAEPATRGEAFIPRAGDRDRSLSILSRAAGWYGAEVTHPNRRFVSAAAPPAPAVSSRVDGEVIGREVRKALRGVTVVMDGHAVGTLVGREQGLQADRYRRGG